MLDAFWSGLGEQLAGRWVARILTPAFGFWVGGLILVWTSTSSRDIAQHGWISALSATTTTVQNLPAVIQIAVAIGGLILIGISAVLAERLTQPLLRLLEGYWYRPLVLRAWIVGRRSKNRAAIAERRRQTSIKSRNPALTGAEERALTRLRANPVENPERLQALEAKQALRPTTRQLVQLARDQNYLRSTPELEEHRMPTRLGDLLRAAELRPKDRYGLDAIVCWPAMWLLLPADTKTELVGARASLDGALRAWLWGVLFLIWTPWNLWALLIGLAVPLLSYQYGILSAAAAFGELMVTAYDLNRMQLYDALHLPRPASARQERARGGPSLTAQLSGLLDPNTTYTFETILPSAPPADSTEQQSTEQDNPTPDDHPPAAAT